MADQPQDLFTLVYALGRATHLATQDDYRVRVDEDETRPHWPTVSQSTLRGLEDWTGLHREEVPRRG